MLHPVDYPTSLLQNSSLVLTSRSPILVNQSVQVTTNRKLNSGKILQFYLAKNDLFTDDLWNNHKQSLL